MKPDRGGTLLGVIIGVVLGLGAALIVAVYVTKVPVPFISNKAQTRTAEQDAAEVVRNKDWDPNAALQSKQPLKPVATPETPASGSVPSVASGVAAPVARPAAPAVAASTAEVAKQPSAPSAPVGQRSSSGKITEDNRVFRVDPGADGKKPTDGTAAPDPLGELAQAKIAAMKSDARPASATADSAEKALNANSQFFVQVGAFKGPDDAETQRAKLATQGVTAKVSEREQSGRTVFRVRVGPFERKEDAEKARERINALGHETALVRVQR